MSSRLVSPSEVRALVAQHLPKSFGRFFANALAGAYSRANQMGQNFDPPERSRTVGHNRWGLGEKAFRTAGKLAGLHIVDCKATCGFPYVALHAGPIVMTQSHVGSRQDMPRASEFRVEQAATNQGELFAVPTTGATSDQTIYLIALHGSESSRFADRPDFLRLIAPTPDFASLITLIDIPLAVPARVAARRQTARPVAVLKNTASRTEDEGGEA